LRRYELRRYELRRYELSADNRPGRVR